jgi:RNA polymerase sigma-70 factor, ECF subfamily
MQAAQSFSRFSRPKVISAASTDLDLVECAAGGDEFAFECIMRRNNRLLFRTARSILKDDAESEDALQESYLRAWRALPTFRADAKLSTWLVRIVINEALERRRRSGVQVIPLDTAMESADPQTQRSMEDDPDLQPERFAMRSEVRRLMEARIDMLPEAFRTVFVLRAVEEMSVEEVSAALDVPEATVRTRFFRARGLLREGLSRDVDLATGDAFSFAGARCDRIVAGVLASFAEDRDISRSSF